MVSKLQRCFFVFSLTFTFAEITHAQSTSTQPEFVLSSTGVGPINKDTPFDKEKIQRLFPKYRVSEEGISDDGEPRYKLNVWDGNTKILEIYNAQDSEQILRVDVFSNKVKNSFGRIIGSSFDAVFPKGIPEDCERTTDSGLIVCSEPGVFHVRYVFEGAWNTPGRDLPPLETLKSFKLMSIFWVAQ